MVHEGGLNVPPRLSSLQVTVPEAMVGKFDVSMTLTVNDTGEPWFEVSGFDVIVLDVESITIFGLGTIVELV